ncbi:nascent polypeptide-associated complex subunit alpha, muscle-specific form-like [Vidua macroura]|uniref:nascent polypeptide-associated complex subunit alpha, muscle-specific form-like n=1 Tax=Vidua macroura TaxID=187451 RepID=UPI0023A8D059|nr:nascent polypeptide-associated complex subunit alpha, muscle-specific form-like [Vidua macroura]
MARAGSADGAGSGTGQAEDWQDPPTAPGEVSPWTGCDFILQQPLRAPGRTPARRGCPPCSHHPPSLPQKIPYCCPSPETPPASACPTDTTLQALPGPAKLPPPAPASPSALQSLPPQTTPPPPSPDTEPRTLPVKPVPSPGPSPGPPAAPPPQPVPVSGCSLRVQTCGLPRGGSRGWRWARGPRLTPVPARSLTQPGAKAAEQRLRLPRERCPRRGETVARGRVAGANTSARNLPAFVGRVGYSKFPMGLTPFDERERGPPLLRAHRLPLSGEGRGAAPRPFGSPAAQASRLPQVWVAIPSQWPRFHLRSGGGGHFGSGDMWGPAWGCPDAGTAPALVSAAAPALGHAGTRRGLSRRRSHTGAASAAVPTSRLLPRAAQPVPSSPASLCREGAAGPAAASPAPGAGRAEPVGGAASPAGVLHEHGTGMPEWAWAAGVSPWDRGGGEAPGCQPAEQDTATVPALSQQLDPSPSPAGPPFPPGRDPRVPLPSPVLPGGRRSPGASRPSPPLGAGAGRDPDPANTNSIARADPSRADITGRREPAPVETFPRAGQRARSTAGTEEHA